MVQRVRCRNCGATRMLLRGFLAGWQRHPSRLREAAVVGREHGEDWQAPLRQPRLPMFSTTALRRWVGRVHERLPACRRRG
jgi:hypothetical protein